MIKDELEDMEKEELIKLIRIMATDFNYLWRCPRCGMFLMRDHVCYHCRFDPTL